MIFEIREKILNFCRTPLNFESILQRLFSFYSLHMTIEQHTLVGATVRGYLSWLYDDGLLDVGISDNILLWRAV